MIPRSGESVTPLWPYSGLVFWLQTMAPASRKRATAGASASTGVLSASWLPIECGQPFTRTSSFTVNGTPSSREAGAPAAQRAVEAFAAARAPSASTIVSALSFRSTLSARASTASMVSSGVAALVR